MENDKERYASSNIIQEMDLIDVIYFVGKKNRKYQAILLHDIEEVMGKDNPKYAEVRKLILDAFNNYTRSMLRIIFGNDLEI